MQMKDVVMVGGCRTAIGDFGGSLKDVPARELAIAVAREAIARAGIPNDLIDEIVMGQIYTGMQGSLPARQVSILASWPSTHGANCLSSGRAVCS